MAAIQSRSRSPRTAAPMLESLESRLHMSGDAYEADNTAALARSITLGSTQTHSIHVATDVDWVRFSLAATTPVTIQTSGASGDTRLWLYRSTTLVASNDNTSTTTKFSKISKTLSAGTYYLKIDGNGGLVPNYSLALTKTAFPLVISRSVKLYSDSTIADGLQLQAKSLTLSTSTTDGMHYSLKLSDGTSLAMVRSGNRLTLSPQFQKYGAGRADNAYMFVAGSCGALVIVGQSDTNLDHSTHLSLKIGAWSGATSVSTSTLAGNWSATSIDNSNLRDKPGTRFGSSTWSMSLSALSASQLRLHAPATSDRGALDWTLNLSGSTITLPTRPNYLHYFSFVTDGKYILGTSVGVEPDDATDVSPTIMLAIRS